MERSRRRAAWEGAFAALLRRGPARLTVLAYHRVAAAAGVPGTLLDNVSASPERFAAQMDFVAAHYRVVAPETLATALREGRPLAGPALLITFDDGYRDNLEAAAPVLAARGLPALLFLATDYIDSGEAFPWDHAAWCFRHSPLAAADLPELGRRGWADARGGLAASLEWWAAVKHLPHARRRAALAALPAALGVSRLPREVPAPPLGWDQVRALARAGIGMGAHTRSHPILTRVPPAEAREEIVASRRRVAEELGAPVPFFAYPNGTAGDFDESIARLVADAGFTAAFTLEPGPATLREIRRRPMLVRRIFVSHRDDLPRFALKLLGLPRLRDAVARGRRPG